MDSLARGTLVNLITRVLSVGLMLAITAITARIGPEIQGAFALFTSVEAVIAALLSGLGVALARRISHHGEDPRALLSASVLACIGLGTLAGGLAGLVSAFGPAAYASLWILALGAPLMLVLPNLVGLWLGQGRMAPIARMTIAPPLLTLLLLLALQQQAPLGLLQVLLCWVAAKVLVALAVLLLLWRGRRLGRPDFAALSLDAGFVATIGLTNLISLLNYRVGLFVVERQLGLAATGVYSIAVVVAELLWFVSGSLTQAAYGRIGTPDRERAAATTVRVLHLSVGALLLAAPLLWLAAWLLVPALLGPAYRDSLLPIALLLPGVMLFGGASSLSAYFTNHAGAPQVPAQVAATSLAINAVLALALVPVMGMAGAAAAASVAYIASVALLAWRFARHARVGLAEVLLPVALRRGGR